MKSQKTCFIISIFFALTINSYAQDAPRPGASDSYESCCGVEPVEFKTENAYVFVPNVFTPNGDSVNDYFLPFINERVVEVIDYIIYTAEGDTVIFDRPTFDFNDKENYAWNGLRYDGSVYKGAFKYTMRVALKEGGLMRVEGRACRIVCGSDASIFREKPGCFFPSQVNNTSGRLDRTLSNMENGCFR